MEFTSFAERKINDDVEKMFGDKDPELKMITKLSMLKELYDNDSKIQDFVNRMKSNAMKESEMITNELKCSLDVSGNVILLEKESQHNLNE
jgi:hypothetical protein